MNEVNAFINDFSAAMCKLSTKEYVKEHEKLMRKIQKLKEMVKAAKIKSLQNFKDGYLLKSVVSSLFCYVFNNNKKDDKGKELWETVSDIESVIGHKLFIFARRYKRIKDSETRSVAKYVISNSNYYYRRENKERIIQKLLNENLLFKNDTAVFVTGLHYAIGDNVFSIARNGQQYRNYIGSCAIQAFGIKYRFCDFIKDNNIKVPPLPEEYSKSWTGDHKGAARVYLSRKQGRIICEKYFEI